AAVSFTSPWPAADAWVTTEREGIMSSRVLHSVHGATVVRLPMSEREVPDVFVSVFLLRRSSVRGEDSLAAHMRIGYAALRVDDASKHLDLQLRATRAEYRPGDTATIELRVRDWKHRGTPAEATIWGADEGVLALTGYQTPNPIAALYAPVGDDA